LKEPDVSDERFEAELRSTLAAMAPATVPVSLVVSLEDVTQRGPGRIRLRIPGTLAFAAGLLGIIAVVTAAAMIIAFHRTDESASNSGAPAVASKIVGSLVWQTDGKYGYAMLRPANWSASDLSTGRGYVAPGTANGQLPMSLTAVNYLVLHPSANETIVERTLFEQNPSLNGWAGAMERVWRSIGGEVTLLRALPEARIYAVTMPDASELSLVALVVDGTQPIAVTLHASGSDADLTQLQQTGVFMDFVTIVESARQVPYDPQNVAPELPSPSPVVKASSSAQPKGRGLEPLWAL
jgi:hypothetical protein